MDIFGAQLAELRKQKQKEKQDSPRTEKQDNNQATSQRSTGDPYKDQLAELRREQASQQRPQPLNAADALADVAGRITRAAADKKGTDLNKQRSSLMNQLQTVQDSAAYITDPDAANANKAEERRIINQLNVLDKAQGNADRYYSNADKFKGTIKGAALGQGAAYADALGTLSQLPGAQDETGRAIADSAYAGYATDPVAIENMRRSVEQNGAPESLGILDTNKKITDASFAAADKLGGQSNAYIGRAKEGANALERFGVDLTQGAFDLATDAAVRFIPVVGPAIGMLPMVTRAFGGAAMEARHNGADEGQQLLYGIKDAGIEYFTEKMAGLGSLRGEKGFLDNLVKNGIDRFVARGGDRFVGDLIAGFGSESAEEIVSYALNHIADKLLRLSNDGFKFTERDFDVGDMLYEGLLGGVLGLFGSAVKNPENATKAEFKRIIKQSTEEAARQRLGALIESRLQGEHNSSFIADMLGNKEARAVFEQMYGGKLTGSAGQQIKAVQQFAETLKNQHGAGAASTAQAQQHGTEEKSGSMFMTTPKQASPADTAPAQKPEMKEAKTPAQRRVEAIINAASTQDQLVQSLQFFQSEPALDAAFEELTGSDIDAYLAEATQEATGGVVPQGDNLAPATPENAQQQASDEFNSVNGAGESGERAEGAVNPFTVWPNMNYNRIAEAQNRNMRDASGSAVDFITGDLYNHNERPYRQFKGELHPKQLEWSAGATQQQYGYAEPKSADNGRRQTDQYNSTIQTAIEQVREDGTNANRIMEGVGEWRNVDPQVRADIMNHIDPRGDYYVSEDKASGGKVVAKAASRLESETNERSDNFYDREMRDAGVEDISPQEIRNGTLANSGARLETRYDDGYVPSERRSSAAVSAYTDEELAAIDKYNRRRDAQKHRENYEKWLTENNIDPGKEPVRNPRLGEPRIEIRSAWMQRTMRDKALLGDLVNGTGIFKQFSAANRLDALRTMYPDANWQFDASTNTITLPGDKTKGETSPFSSWEREKKGETSNAKSGPEKAGAGLEGTRSRGLDSRTSLREISEVPQLGLESAKGNVPNLSRVGHQRHGRLRTRLSDLGFTIHDRNKLTGLGKRLSDLCRDVAPECPVTFFSSDGVARNADTMKVFRYGPIFECKVNDRSAGVFIDLSTVEAAAKREGCTPEAAVMHDISHYYIEEFGVDPADIVSAFINESTAHDKATIAVFNAANAMAKSRFGKTTDQLTPEQSGVVWNELICDGFGAVDRCFKSGPLYAQTQFLPFVKFVRNFFNNTDFTATTGDFDLSNATSTISPFMSKEEAQQRGDYRLGPKAAAKLDAEAHANTPTIDTYDDGGIDVDADDFELPYRTDNKEMQRREDLNRQSDAEERQQPRPKNPEPESSAEFIQQNRLRKSDFENRETERGGTEVQYKAEQAEIREEIEHDEAYDRAQEDGKRLAEMKQAYGEKTQANLAKAAEKAWSLVGNSRVTENGNVGFTYHSEGGRDIESFAHVFREFAAGRQTFTQLAEAYDNLGSYSEQKKGSYFYDKVFAEQFERLRDALDNGDVRTKDGALDPKFVRSVEDLTKRVVHRFEYMQKMLKFRSHLAEVYGEGKPFRTKAGALAKALEAAHRFQLRPSTAFKMLSGYDKVNGSAWYELANMARDATKNYINTFQNAQDYLRELAERKDWEDFSTGKTTVKNVIPGLKYDGERLSANAAVSFLKMLETDGAYDHIIRNGIVEMARTEKELYGGQNNNGFGDVTGYSQTFDPISEETRAMLDKAKTSKERNAARERAVAELDALKGALHAEVEACPAAKAFYDASFAPLNFLKKALNKTSRKVWGTDAAVQDKFYWPLEAGGKREGNELLNDHSFGLDQYRNVQARTGDRGGLKVRPATDVMQGYIRSASHWAAYQELSDMLEILSKDFRDTSSITQLLNDNAGKAWSKWLENYEADLNENRGKDKGYAGKIIGSLRSNLAQSSLLLNAGVALKQAPSGLDFMTALNADIVARRFATGFFRSARSYRNNPLIQTMEAYTKMLKNRQAGYNTVETGEATETGRKGFVNKLVNKLPSWMTNWITKTDFRTVANGLLACEDQVKRNIKNGVDGYANLKEGTDAYYQKVADLFENAVMDTQPIYNKEYRADALRTDNEVLRILNMFRTQQTQNYNNLVETIGEYNAAKLSGDEAATKAARNRMGRTIAGQVSSAFVFAMLDAAAKMLMHKKKQYEDEDGDLSASIISQKVGWNFVNSLASTSWLTSKISPFVINQMTKLANKATDGKVAKSDFYSGSLDGTLALVDDFASALDSFTTKPSLKTGKALVLNLASLTGMPLKNGYNIVNAAIMHFYLDPSGKNINNEDDIISYLDSYNKLSDTSKAKQSVLRAISVNSKGNSEGADTIMATLNLDDDDIAKAAKQQLKDSFISGDIDSMTYRNMLEKYFGMRQTEAWDLWKDVNEAKKFADTKARVFSSEDESKAFDKTMSKLTTTTDPTGKQRFAEISRLGLNEEDTDTFVKKYMTETFSKNYDALRSINIRSNDAARIVSSIDENESGSLSQDEVYGYLLDHPASKKTVDALWEANGWKTSLDKYAEDYAKQPVNILVSFGMSKAEATRAMKTMDSDGNGSLKQEEFFAYLKAHPDQEEALKAVFAVKWPKSNYESKKRSYG